MQTEINRMDFCKVLFMISGCDLLLCLSVLKIKPQQDKTGGFGFYPELFVPASDNVAPHSGTVELLCHTCSCVMQSAHVTRQARSLLIWIKVFYFEYISLIVSPDITQIISGKPSPPWWSIGADGTDQFFVFGIWRRFHRMILSLLALVTMLLSMLSMCLLKWNCCALLHPPYGILKCWHFVCFMKNCLNSSFKGGKKLRPHFWVRVQTFRLSWQLGATVKVTLIGYQSVLFKHASECTFTFLLEVQLVSVW